MEGYFIKQLNVRLTWGERDVEGDFTEMISEFKTRREISLLIEIRQLVHGEQCAINNQIEIKMSGI